jgi:hypothetical protein
LKTIYRIQDFFPWWFPKYFVLMQERLVWHNRFRGEFEDREKAINIYLEHIEEVKRVVPPEKLLVYDVNDGWEPLCRFLKVSLPDKPFPHLNETRDYLNYINNVRIIAGIAAAVGITALLVIVLKLFSWW